MGRPGVFRGGPFVAVGFVRRRVESRLTTVEQPDPTTVPRESLRISSVEQPGWRIQEGHVPTVGQVVYCTEGPAEVVGVLGRTSDGSRLLELRLSAREKPFFASSSNVLVRTEAVDE